MTKDGFQYAASVALETLKNLRVYFRHFPDELPWSVRSALDQVDRVVIWTSEMHQAAVTGAQDAFTGTVMPSWPDSEPSFWWFRDFDFGATDGHNHLRSSAVLFLPVSGSEGGLGTVAFIHPDEKGKIRTGLTVDRSGKTVSSRTTCGWLAMKAFMETEIAQLDAIQFDRPTRRRAIKENERLPEIRIIQLRKRATSDHDGAEREYHHRWIVKGHWRRLAHPRKADGVEVTFVSAYVKGPDGAPLLQPRESVYVVAR